jgi:hypothetical protein
VTAVGGWITHMNHIHPDPLGSNPWVVPIVGWGFPITGILMLLPETVVTASRSSLAGGETLTLEVSQPGPIRLHYLRVNFRGERLFVPVYPNRPAQRKTVERTPLGTFRMYSQDEVEVLGGDSFHTFFFVIPKEIEPSGTTSIGKATWRVEVWGNVVNGFNFVHPFVIDVA